MQDISTFFACRESPCISLLRCIQRPHERQPRSRHVLTIFSHETGTYIGQYSTEVLHILPAAFHRRMVHAVKHGVWRMRLSVHICQADKKWTVLQPARADVFSHHVINHDPAQNRKLAFTRCGSAQHSASEHTFSEVKQYHGSFRYAAAARYSLKI